MAILHVAAAGSNTSPYETWAKAATSLPTAVAAMAAGDILYIDSGFTETSTSSLTFPGTLAAPNHALVCTHSGASGADALATGAVFTNSTTSCTIGGNVYVYGLGVVGSSASASGYTFGTTAVTFPVFESCAFSFSGASNSVVAFGTSSASGNEVTLINCTFQFNDTRQRVGIQSFVNIIGGSWLSGGTSPTGVFNMGYGARGAKLEISGFDFSNLSAGTNIVQASTAGNTWTANLSNCKLPASWSGVAWVTPAAGGHVNMSICSDGAQNYDVTVSDYTTAVVDETTIVLSGGASNGTTTFSRKMDSAANVEYPVMIARGPPMMQWVASSGSAKTATVEFVHDTNVAAGQGAGASSAFQDDEWWLEVTYLGSSATPIASVADSAKADVLAAAADITSSSVTWTTTGMTTPVKQKFVVTFTQAMSGYIIGRVCCGKASKTIYYNPAMTVA